MQGQLLLTFILFQIHSTTFLNYRLLNQPLSQCLQQQIQLNQKSIQLNYLYSLRLLHQPLQFEVDLSYLIKRLLDHQYLFQFHPSSHQFDQKYLRQQFRPSLILLLCFQLQPQQLINSPMLIHTPHLHVPTLQEFLEKVVQLLVNLLVQFSVHSMVHSYFSVE